MVATGVQERVHVKWWIGFNHRLLQPHFHAVAQDVRYAVCRKSGSY